MVFFAHNGDWMVISKTKKKKAKKGFIDGKKHQKEKSFSEIGLR